tara:strand:- start:2945 stop:3739 length:795 start_codon:yes stop_codon:yes gene_type:complete
MFEFLRPLWQNRHFVPAAISGEFKSRVARSKIGTLWFVLQPLAMATIYALVLSEVLGAKLGGVERAGAYSVYLLAGIMAWSLFTEILTRCINMFLEYANVLKKISFPKVYLPIVILGGALINNVLLFVTVAAIIALYGFYPQFGWIALILPMTVSIMLAFGVGVVLGVMNIFTRDVAQVMTVVTNLWFWLTPIVYTDDMVGSTMGRFLVLNPMTPVVKFYHDVLVYQVTPNYFSLLYPACVGVGLMLLSGFVFWRASPEIVDAL